MGRVLVPLLLGFLAGCAHAPLSVASLEATRTVAIVSRVSAEAGPHSFVFVEDASYREQLASRRLEPKEADRRLALVLARGSFQKESDGAKRLASRTVTRFELADSLRSELLERLPRRAPWTRALNPVEVARVLESFLVQEENAKPPDYDLLLPSGADTVLEVIVEDYGMRSENGRAGAFLMGSARMFRIGGGEVYHRKFAADEVKAQLEPIDPFVIAKEASKFGDRLKALVNGVVELLAADLSPTN